MIIYLFCILSIVVFAVYALLLIIFIYGWLRTKSEKKESADGNIFVSIIVPVRNEEKNIPVLLDCLLAQNYPKDQMEILVSDDNSEDATTAIIREYSAKYPFIRYIAPDKNSAGKKAALHNAVLSSKGELIITTDADCCMGNYWIQSIAGFYKKTHADMIICPVIIKDNGTLFSKMQSLEFASLVASGAGAAGALMPILCNGANLAFRKSSYLEFDDPTGKNFASGDDMLFMLNLKKNHCKISFFKCRDAMVSTIPSQNINSFFMQRIRWVSKSKAYRDPVLIITAMTVLLTAALWPLLMFFSIFSFKIFLTLLVCLFLKISMELLLLLTAASWFGQQDLVWFYLPVQALYPVYAIHCTIAGIFGKLTWKGREIQ